MSSISSTIEESSRVSMSQNRTGPKNYIDEGLGITLSPTPFTVQVQPGIADIERKYQEITEMMEIDLAPRTANLLYLKKSEYSDCPSIGSVQAKYPIDMIDNNTIGFWIPNKTGNIPNLAVGKSSIAVANDLIPSGTVAVVDGRCDYAIKGNGANGQLLSTNSTGFPTSGAKGLCLCVTINAINAQVFACFGTGGGTKFMVGTDNGTRLKLADGNTWFHDTGFDMSINETYEIEVYHDGINSLNVYVNGNKISSATLGWTVSGAVLYLLSSGGANYSNTTIHYVEIRNAVRNFAQVAQIAQISNDLLLPCTYQTPNSPIPLMTANSSQGCVASASSEYATSHQAYCAFRKETVVGDNGWQTPSGVTTGQIQITFPVAFAPKFVDIKCGNSLNYAPKDFIIFGSNDGGLTKTTLLTLTGISWTVANQLRRFNILEAGNYKTLGSVVTANNGGSGLLVNNLDFGTDVVSTTDIRSILPANSISLGYVKTNSTAVVEIDSNSYKYGVRKGATGGNRKAFLGWKYFTAVTAEIPFENPFGTRMVKPTWFYAEDSNGRNASPILFSDNATSMPTANSSNAIVYRTSNVGCCVFNGALKTNGYIGCYAEVLE